MGKMSRVRQALRAFAGQPMALQLGGRGAEITSLVQRLARNEQVDDQVIRAVLTTETEEEIQSLAALYAQPQIIPGQTKGSSVAYVTVFGVMTYGCECQPYVVSSRLLTQKIKELTNNPEIGTVVLHINSPGGEVGGVSECADAVFAARKKKNVIGLIDPLCASAAMWVGSQCTQLISVPSGFAGSIGVFCLHIDQSKMLEMYGVKPTFIVSDASPNKVKANFLEPLSADAEQHIKEEVNATCDEFLAAVSRGRNVPVDTIIAKFGGGYVMSAADAKRVKMIDQVMPFEVAIQKCGIGMMEQEDMRARRRGEAEEAPQEAEAVEQLAAEEKKNQIVTELVVDARGVEAGTERAIRAFDAMREAANKAREAVEQANASAAQKNDGEPAEIPDAIEAPATVAETEEVVEPVHDAPDDNKQLDPMNATIKLSEGSLADFKLDLDLSGLDKDSGEKASPDASEARRRRLELLSA